MAAQKGIEESIRRCEELLALTPLAFTLADPKSNPASRGLSGAKQAKARVDMPGIAPSHDMLWKRNMDLLGTKSATAHASLEERVDMEREIAPVSSETSQTVPCQKLRLQLESGATSHSRGSNSQGKCDMPSDQNNSVSEPSFGEQVDKQRDIAPGSNEKIQIVPCKKTTIEIGTYTTCCTRRSISEGNCGMPSDWTNSGAEPFSDEWQRGINPNAIETVQKMPSGDALSGFKIQEKFFPHENNSAGKCHIPSDWTCSTKELAQERLQLSSKHLQNNAALNHIEELQLKQREKYRGNNLNAKLTDSQEIRESVSISCCLPGECSDGSSPDTMSSTQQVSDNGTTENLCPLHKIGRSSEVSLTSRSKISDSEVSTRDMHLASGKDESAAEFPQKSMYEDSQITLDSRWEDALEASTATACANSEQRTDPSCVEHKHKMFPKERNKSTPRQCCQEESLERYQRSKSVSRERIQDGLRTTSYTKIFNNMASSTGALTNDTPSKDRITNLAKPRTEVYKKLAELKALFEEEQLQECSFKPAVGRKPNPESVYYAPIFERISKIQQKIENRKRARKVYEKEELDNCSFRPRINWNSQFLDKLTYQPIEKRFQELQRKKVEKLANAQLRKDLGLTFKPEINQKSIQLLKQKGLETSVADRLATQKHSFHEDCKHEHEKQKITFTPEINKNTEYIMATSKQFGGHHVGFLQRQEQYLQSAEEKKRFKEHEIPVEFTFQPNIGNSAVILKQSPSRDSYDETDFERYERLAYKDRERLWQAREKASENYYAQFKFQPELDEFSRILAGQTSIHDVCQNNKGQKVKETLEQAAEKEFHQKCPFRPEVNSYKSSSGNIRSIVYQRRLERKDKVNSEQEIRSLKELQELKECTFKPSLNPSVPRPQTPAVIKGFERHLELQSIAKQMKKEQEELERKVFFSHAYTTPTRQYTIPKPFILQTVHCGTRHMRRSSSSIREEDTSSGFTVPSSCHSEGMIRPFSSDKGDDSSGLTMSSCHSMQCNVANYEGLVCQSRETRHSVN